MRHPKLNGSKKGLNGESISPPYTNYNPFHHPLQFNPKVVIPHILYEKEKFFVIAMINKRLILGHIKISDRFVQDVSDRSLERWDIEKKRFVLLADVKEIMAQDIQAITNP